MNEIRVIYSLFGSAQEAKAVAKTLIMENLVACANHLAPATSQYMWDGKLQENQEFPVLLKTSEEKAKAAMERLKSLHSYDVPAILNFAPENCDGDYQKWLTEQLNK